VLPRDRHLTEQLPIAKSAPQGIGRAAGSRQKTPAVMQLAWWSALKPLKRFKARHASCMTARLASSGDRLAIFGSVILLVKSDDPGGRNNWTSYLAFFAITLLPWVLLIWLMWPALVRR
jgi:hypothetical protein